MARRSLAGRPRYASSVAQMRPPLRWSLTPPTMSASGAGSLITVDSRGLIASLRGVVGRVGEAIVEGYRREILPVGEAAFDGWPVVTGYSRSRLRAEVFATRSGLTVRYSCDAPYAATLRDGRVVAELLEVPLRRARARFAAVVAARGVR